MNLAISVALLVVGIILLIMGFNATQSVGSEISEAVRGTPTNRSIWLIVGGAAAAIIGAVGLFRRRT
jgi:divalent metal cation (Fe/Co/Zn/Cd) transporter